MGRQGVWHSPCKKSPQGSSAEIRVVLADLSKSMRNVLGIVDNLGNKMEDNVKNLEVQMKEGFTAEGAQKKKGLRESRG